MKIYLDIDGVLNKLFLYPNFEELIRCGSVEPFLNARPNFAKDRMEKAVSYLKNRGYEIGVVSYYGAKTLRGKNEKIKEAKLEWLNRYFPYADETVIIPCGKSKAKNVTDINGILIDDSKANVKQWKGPAVLYKNGMDLVGLLYKICESTEETKNT